MDLDRSKTPPNLQKQNVYQITDLNIFVKTHYRRCLINQNISQNTLSHTTSKFNQIRQPFLAFCKPSSSQARKICEGSNYTQKHSSLSFFRTFRCNNCFNSMFHKSFFWLIYYDLPLITKPAVWKRLAITTITIQHVLLLEVSFEWKQLAFTN